MGFVFRNLETKPVNKWDLGTGSNEADKAARQLVLENITHTIEKNILYIDMSAIKTPGFYGFKIYLIESSQLKEKDLSSLNSILNNTDTATILLNQFNNFDPDNRKLFNFNYDFYGEGNPISTATNEVYFYNKDSYLQYYNKSNRLTEGNKKELSKIIPLYSFPLNELTSGNDGFKIDLNTLTKNAQIIKSADKDYKICCQLMYYQQSSGATKGYIDVSTNLYYFINGVEYKDGKSYKFIGDASYGQNFTEGMEKTSLFEKFLEKIKNEGITLKLPSSNRASFINYKSNFSIKNNKINRLHLSFKINDDLTNYNFGLCCFLNNKLILNYKDISEKNKGNTCNYNLTDFLLADSENYLKNNSENEIVAVVFSYKDNEMFIYDLISRKFSLDFYNTENQNILKTYFEDCTLDENEMIFKNPSVTYNYVTGKITVQDLELIYPGKKETHDYKARLVIYNNDMAYSGINLGMGERTYGNGLNSFKWEEKSFYIGKLPGALDSTSFYLESGVVRLGNTDFPDLKDIVEWEKVSVFSIEDSEKKTDINASRLLDDNNITLFDVNEGKKIYKSLTSSSSSTDNRLTSNLTIEIETKSDLITPDKVTFKIYQTIAMSPNSLNAGTAFSKKNKYDTAFYFGKSENDDMKLTPSKNAETQYLYGLVKKGDSYYYSNDQNCFIWNLEYIVNSSKNNFLNEESEKKLLLSQQVTNENIFLTAVIKTADGESDKYKKLLETNIDKYFTKEHKITLCLHEHRYDDESSQWTFEQDPFASFDYGTSKVTGGIFSDSKVSDELLSNLKNSFVDIYSTLSKNYLEIENKKPAIPTISEQEFYQTISPADSENLLVCLKYPSDKFNIVLAKIVKDKEASKSNSPGLECYYIEKDTTFACSIQPKENNSTSSVAYDSTVSFANWDSSKQTFENSQLIDKNEIIVSDTDSNNTTMITVLNTTNNLLITIDDNITYVSPPTTNNITGSSSTQENSGQIVYSIKRNNSEGKQIYIGLYPLKCENGNLEEDEENYLYTNDLNKLITEDYLDKSKNEIHLVFGLVPAIDLGINSGNSHIVSKTDLNKLEDYIYRYLLTDKHRIDAKAEDISTVNQDGWYAEKYTDFFKSWGNTNLSAEGNDLSKPNGMALNTTYNIIKNAMQPIYNQYNDAVFDIEKINEIQDYDLIRPAQLQFLENIWNMQYLSDAIYPYHETDKLPIALEEVDI